MRKFIIILCLCFFATPCLAAKEEYIGSRRFQVLVRQDLADEAARVFVETYALEQGMRNLAKNSHLQFAIEPHQALSERELAGFAKILYDLQIVEKGVETYPPEVHTFVHVSMELRENWRQLLAQYLQNRELVKLYGRIFEMQKALLADYDALADEIIALPEGAPGGRLKSDALQNIVNRMRATEDFEALLTAYDVKWHDPKLASEHLQKLLKIDGQNALLLTALAEALLQLDRPADAQLVASEAVSLAPDYPKAHDIYGIILLRQQLPALASKSFSESIALSPSEPRYRLHRAAAFLVQEEILAMCQDLRIACVYGECEQYAWARRQGKCSPEQEEPTVTEQELQEKLREPEEEM